MALRQAEISNFRGQHAVVIGASMAGLLAARVLSDHFERVTVIERDRLPQGIEPRKGVPQGRQPHALLSKGCAIMDDLFPDLFPALVAQGAVEMDSAADLKWYQLGRWKNRFSSQIRIYGVSRPLLEGSIRQRVAARSNVSILDGCTITGLVSSADRTQVTGIQVRSVDGEDPEMTLMADLVVDASGRGSQAPHWLTALGYPAVEETTVKINVGYASRIYRRPAHLDYDWKVLGVFAIPPDGKRIGAIVPMEGNAWNVMLACWAGDYPPTDEAAFLAYAQSLPTAEIYEAIKDAEALTPIYAHKIPTSRRRHYERLSRRPEGFLVLGDAACNFNPIYGQGITIAAVEASILQTCLQDQWRRHPQGELKGLARRFQKAIARVIAAPWLLTTTEDYRYPETEGRRPLGLGLFQWYSRRLIDAAEQNPRVAQRFYEVMHMLKPPAAMFTPDLLAAVLFGKNSPRTAPQPDKTPQDLPGEVEDREPVGATHR